MEKEILNELENKINQEDQPIEETEIEISEVADISKAAEADIENQNDAVSERIDVEDSNTSNCLALTIKKEYKLVAIKNVFIHSLKVTWKVIVSTVTLHLLKLFL